MKKIILPAMLVAIACISFNSCKKTAVKPEPAAAATSAEKVICPLSDIYTTSYSELGVLLCGPYSSGSMWGIGGGTTGALDTKLNCNKAPGPGCNVVNAYVVTSINISTALSDGVMTIAEQQALVDGIQAVCTSHMSATYGAGYAISSYDCHFMQALCGGCSGIVLQVNYTASKPCKN